MQLIHDINECTHYLKNGKAKRKSVSTMTRYIAASNMHDLVKYYAYRYLIQTYSKHTHLAQTELDALLARRQANTDIHAEAEVVFIHLRNAFMKMSSQDNHRFCELLHLFANYYEQSAFAKQADEWAVLLSENKYWLQTSFSFLFDVCRVAANYVIEHPVQSLSFLLIVSAVSVKAEDKTASDKMVVMTYEYPGSVQSQYFATTDKEFNNDPEQIDPSLLEKVIQQKVKVDPTLDKATAAVTAQYCDALKSEMKATILSKQDHHGHLARVLANPLVEVIHCKKTVRNGAASGNFDSLSRAIEIAVHESRLDLVSMINHEGLHADSFTRHASIQCPMTATQFPISPVYQSTDENFAKWHRAFDHGEQRIAEFYKLWVKALTNKKLTVRELREFETFKLACEGVRPVEIKATGRSREDYDLIKEAMAVKRIDKLGLIFDGVYIIDGEITSVSAFGETFSYTMKTTSTLQSLFLQPFVNKGFLEGPVYSKYPPEQFLSEREAWALMHLPPLAAKTFYKEVYALREADVKACAPDYLNATKLNQRFRIGLFFANQVRTMSNEEAAIVYEEATSYAGNTYTMDKAIEMFKGLLRIPSMEFRAHLMLGQIAYLDKKYRAAIEHYQAAHDGGLMSLSSHYSEAHSHFILDNYHEALNACEQGLAHLQQSSQGSKMPNEIADQLVKLRRLSDESAGKMLSVKKVR